MTAAGAAGTSVEIEGTTLTWPIQVRKARIGSATFTADARAAARLLPNGIVPFTIRPGRTLVTLTMADYLDNDLGDYDEFAVAIAVREAGGPATMLRSIGATLRGKVTTFTAYMPVDQPFTLAAGRQLWGFPKTLDDVSIGVEGDRATCTWNADGAHVVTLTVPAGTGRRIPTQELDTFTVLDGALQRTTFTMGSEQGRIGPGGAEVTLGTHPIADELRRLKLSRRAVFTTWMATMTGTFQPPRPMRSV